MAEKLELYSVDFANVHIQQQPFESPCIQYVRPSKSGKFQRLAAAQKSVENSGTGGAAGVPAYGGGTTGWPVLPAPRRTLLPPPRDSPILL